MTKPIESMSREVRKRRKVKGSTRLWGVFDWRYDFSGGHKGRMNAAATEEEYIAGLVPNKQRAYMKKRAERYEKWINGIYYQLSLRRTQALLKRLNKDKEKLLQRRFKDVKMNDVVVPAEAAALMALAVLNTDATTE
jgi:hypothetical protein